MCMLCDDEKAYAAYMNYLDAMERQGKAADPDKAIDAVLDQLQAKRVQYWDDLSLEEITKAFKQNPNLPNLLTDGKFKDMINSRQDAWRRIVGLGVTNGIGLPAFSGSLAYYDSYRRERLPADVLGRFGVPPGDRSAQVCSHGSLVSESQRGRSIARPLCGPAHRRGDRRGGPDGA